MTAAIVFSRDRPAQLDLLLRSIRRNARWLGPITVLYTCTGPDYRLAYTTCADEHPDVTFVDETAFRAQTLALLPEHGHATFLCDDDVIYRRVDRPTPAQILNSNRDVLCVSLRLGTNTTECYSLRSSQQVPTNIEGFRWRGMAGDFGYPGSLDGHVFRAEQLRVLIDARDPQWTNPNELEDHLHRATQTSLLPLMVCYPKSVLVGVPVNLTNTTHQTNRHAETHRAPLATLNRKYLGGGRLDIGSVIPSMVDAAHTEFFLYWETKEAAA